MASVTKLVQELKEKEEVRSPLIVEFGNVVDKIIHLCYHRFCPETFRERHKRLKIDLLLI